MKEVKGFVMDYSLLRVAKHLRLLGYSAVCNSALRQRHLLEMAARDNLGLITSSRSLIQQVVAHNRATGSQRTVVAYDSDGGSVYSGDEGGLGEIVLYELPHKPTLSFSEVMSDIIRRAGLCYDYRRVLSRCVACNDILLHVAKESVRGDVHPKVYEIYDAFTRCPTCRKVFWGMDGTGVINFASFRTLQFLERLCKTAGAPELKPAPIMSLYHFRSFPRAIHMRVFSFLPDDALWNLAVVFPKLKDLTTAVRGRSNLAAPLCE
ncbi:hypothetical protein TRVL_09880 [Trypanosoma vivax]|nr:hypothetical protein TRVL_09880 [Trypanosoma vivax]